MGRVTQQQTKNGNTVIMTESYTYNGATTQVSAVTRTGPRGASGTLYYQYDDNGNIINISDGSESIIYLYDSQNQLILYYRTDGELAECWEYNGAGNVTRYYECIFGFSTGEIGEIYESIWYDYDDPRLCDVLTERAHESFGHDSIGNMTFDNTWTYTWEHGRQLASMSDGLTTWEFSYDANGMRTQRTNGTDTYTYTYNGGQLTQMTKGADTLKFTYDASGTPMTVTWNGTLYYYATNLQGDVTDILDANGHAVVSYFYDAWGDVWSYEDDVLVELNPLRYRGYVYDQETDLYYVGSRYYNPETGRWLNADNQLASGDLTGGNLFAYCGNNPVNRIDPTGEAWIHWLAGAAIVAGFAALTVLTCGGSLALAATSVGLVANGIAAATTATTVAAAAFIGSATVYATAAVTAACNSKSVNDFRDQGNWGIVAATAGTALVNGVTAYATTRTPTSTPTNANTSRGSTGRTEPANLREQLAMEQVKSNPSAGTTLTRITLNDPRWPSSDGWVKMQQIVPTSQGNINIHYVYNQTLKIFDDFKFKP